MDFQKERNLMVENQLKPNMVNEPKIYNIFNEIEKEHFIKDENKHLTYSDNDIKIINNRGYLKNLHLAQLIYFSNLKNDDNVLHIGGLTGYVTYILSKFVKHVVVIEDDIDLFNQLKINIDYFKIKNVELINNNLKEGCLKNSPYDLIFIDSLINEYPSILIDQLKNNLGRLIMIEKVTDQLGKCVRFIKDKDKIDKDILFDAFSSFSLYKNKEKFVF
tara:strand:- start:440 stop:1093 length:654 start_codon:yes stop_codon:yes gene_type:complete